MVDGVYPLEYQEENPLYKFDVKWNEDLHCLHRAFSNQEILNDFFFVRCASESGFGAPYGKNARERTRIYWKKDPDQYESKYGTLILAGTKTYSRRVERIEAKTHKKRSYVSQTIDKRICWFLDNSPYVHSYKRTATSDVSFSYQIQFIDCISDAGKIKTEIEKLQIDLGLANNLKIAYQHKIDTFLSLDQIQDALDKTYVKIDSINKKIDALKEKL